MRNDFNRLFSEHAPYLTAVCSRYVSDADAVRDVLQESFIKIFTSIDTFEDRGEGSLKAWMRRIVVNESISYLREKRKLSFLNVGVEMPDIPDAEPEMDGVPPDALQMMIKKLPEGYRTVLNLYVFEEKSHREIASILGISENTSYSQFSRAKSYLAKLILDYRTNGEGLER